VSVVDADATVEMYEDDFNQRSHGGRGAGEWASLHIAGSPDLWTTASPNRSIPGIEDRDYALFSRAIPRMKTQETKVPERILLGIRPMIRKTRHTTDQRHKVAFLASSRCRSCRSLFGSG